MTFRNLTNQGQVDDSLADRIEEYLLQTYAMRRRPTAAARLLALIVDLYTKGLPFPQRTAVARDIGCSKDGVDAALSSYLARDEIALEMRMVPGNVAKRESVIRERYFIPSQTLLTIAGRTKNTALRAA